MIEVWTANPDLQPKSEWESITYVFEAELRERGFESLFDSLISGDYEGLGDSWKPHFLSVSWSEGNQENVEEAMMRKTRLTRSFC